MFLGNMLTAAAGATRSSFEIGIAEWNCRMELQIGIADWNCRMELQNGNAEWNSVVYYYYYS